MMGEDDADDLSEGSFNSKSVWARMSVVAAGPIFNLILACVFCFILIMITGYRSPEITGVLDGYSAQEEGLQAGDVITEINGRNVHIWDDVSLYTMTHADEAPFKVEYERDRQEIYGKTGASTVGRRCRTAAWGDKRRYSKTGDFQIC